MFKVFKISKDAYISRRNPDQNQGLSSQTYVVSSSYVGHTRVATPVDRRTLIGVDTDELIAHAGDTASVVDFDYRVRFFVSDIRLNYNDFSITAYPLEEPWQEGIGDEFRTNIGVTWESRGTASNYVWDEGDGLVLTGSSALDPWFNEGGTYISGSAFTNTIFKEDMMMETDLNQFVEDVVISGSYPNEGLIYIADKTNINFAMYSKDSITQLSPFVIAYKDDYVVESSSVIEQYSGDTNNIFIKPVTHKSRLEKGEQFYSILDIRPQYSVAGFTYDKKLRYLENVKYKIVYNTTSQEMIPYSNYTRVPIRTDGMTVTFSTEDFTRGSYYIQYMYENSSGGKQYSDKHYFYIE